MLPSLRGDNHCRVCTEVRFILCPSFLWMGGTCGDVWLVCHITHANITIILNESFPLARES